MSSYVVNYVSYHALSLPDSLLPVSVLPAKERSKRDDDGHDPDQGDQHVDGGGGAGVNVVGVGHGPVPVQGECFLASSISADIFLGMIIAFLV